MRETVEFNAPSNPCPNKPRTETTSARLYGSVLLLVVLAILYGSLFPFEFLQRSYPGGPLFYLLSTWRDWDHRGDLLANILLYLPFGFFAVNALPARFPRAFKFVLTTIAGVALSSSVEVTQFHDVGRVTSMGDVYANVIGTGAGAAVAILLGVSRRWPLLAELAGNPTEGLLLTMFFAYRLYPYVPVIDLHKYWHAVRPMLTTPSLPPDEFLRYFVTWLFIAAIIHVLYGPRRFLILFPLLCGAEFIGKVFVIDNALKLNDIVSAASAWLVWAVLLRRMPEKFGIVALLFAAMIAIERLQPFEFEEFPHAFGWIPFASLMHGSIAINIQAFCQKFYEYGGLIWLLNRGGARLLVSTLLAAIFLFATSFAECWLPGRSAEITDAIIAVLMGCTFALLRQKQLANGRNRIGYNRVTTI
jgi:VanZ family protein